MKRISRRNFLVNTGTFAAIYPMLGLIEGCTPDAEDLANLKKGLQISDENGMNLTLYFINLDFDGLHLVPTEPASSARVGAPFMIVQIPQQSLHEEFVITPNDTTAPNDQQNARLSSYSFLAFRLWPGMGKKDKRKIRYHISELLNWRNKKVFKLISTFDVRADMLSFNKLPDVKGVVIAENKPGTIIDFTHYENLVNRLIPASTQLLTIFELPAGLLLAPHKHAGDVFIEVSRNDYQISKKEFQLFVNGQRVKRTILERRNIQLKYRSESSPNYFIDIPPALRAIGIISGNSFSASAGDNPCQSIKLDTAPKGNYLPSLLDEAELVFLNQARNRDEIFDIKVKSPFLLTSAGASLKFAYKNYNISEDYPSLSLVEYEHHFQEGRDNYIKVARIGVIAPSAQKALHIKIAERKIINGISFLDYKEFVEVIEPDKNFPAAGSGSNAKIKYYTPTNPSAQPGSVSPGPHYDDQINFSCIGVRQRRTPPILPINDDTIKSFWVHHNKAAGEAERLIVVDFDVYDKNGKKLDKAAQSPIFFMRRDLFCDEGAVKNLLNNNLSKFDDGIHLRIAFQNQVVAYTPDDPTITVSSTEKSVNKINQLQTEYADYYFNIANVLKQGNVFDKVPYVIYPQISRAKVFIEHFQQYSENPVPALVKYSPDYLQNYFNDKGNVAKVILKQTENFVRGNILNFFDEASSTVEQQTRLNTGYREIEEVFNNAGDRVGGLINPDIKNKVLAFGDQGLTYAEDINQQWSGYTSKSIDKIMKTVDLFKGASAEILNGVSLKMILEEVLDTGLTPGFGLDKIIGEIENIEAFIAELGNVSIIKDALDFVKKADEEVRRFKREIDAGKQKIEEYERILSNSKNELISRIPDLTKIKNACKIYFEQQRLAVFSRLPVTPEEIAELYEVAKEEFLRDVYNSAEEIRLAASYINNYSNQIFTRINQYSSTLKAEYEKELKARLDALTTQVLADIKKMCNDIATKPLKDLSASALPIYSEIKIEDYYSATNGAEGLYVLIEKHKEFSGRYLKGEAVAADLKLYAKAIADKQEKINQSVYTRIKTLISCYNILADGLSAAEKTALDHFFVALRILEKFSVSYYVERYEQYKKDFEDIQNTYTKELKEVFDAARLLALRVQRERKILVRNYLNTLISGNPDLDALRSQWNAIQEKESLLVDEFEKIVFNAKERLKVFGVSKQLEAINDTKKQLKDAVSELGKYLDAYKKALLDQGKSMLDNVEKAFKAKLEELKEQSQIDEAIAEYERVKNILTTPKKKELKYSWETGKFKSANLGIVKFNPESGPATRLKVDVRTTVFIDPLKFPSVIDRVESYAENSLTNFSLNFLSVITVGFEHVKFVTGTGIKSDVSVSIRDVKFEGAMSFIQMLEELLGGLGDGFAISIQPKNVGISYYSPVFGISTPGFIFSNISIGVMLTVFFDKRPMELSFMLAKPESKATIAAGILGGGFYCALTAEPKRGLKAIEMALEMGAIFGIGLGPIKGEVRFMVGLFFKKDDSGVTMEGYFIAEGVLSVWIISVSARLYMYVRSKNSHVTGGCTASYSAKLGFIRKTFSGSYSKTIAGAERKQDPATVKELLDVYQIVNSKSLKDPDDSFYALIEEDPYEPMNDDEWNQFYSTFF